MRTEASWGLTMRYAVKGYLKTQAKSTRHRNRAKKKKEMTGSIEYLEAN